MVNLEYFPSATSYMATSTVPFNSQTNLHVVVTLAVGVQPQLFVNGALAGTAPYVMTTMLMPTYFRIGGSLDCGTCTPCG